MVIAWPAFIVLSPFFILILILLYTESAGHPFFKQKRIGKNMVPFRLIKFRSMTTKINSDLGSFTLGDNSRVTRIGSFLRKTKIDELPQLFNVLTGDMSIIGPRPEVPQWVEEFADDYREVLKISPGLSDYASIKYRDEESLLANQDDPENYYKQVLLPDKLRLSKAYIRNITFKNDLRIMLETLNRIRR
jgi:lipopolysaccharide/colanic/teichoic acid biosynthesis glycosyltransferase